ncbi:MAG: hypothetical protein RIQ56_190 [Candidatus Parcubacteria bacterium]|jgi:hypothetical protein
MDLEQGTGMSSREVRQLNALKDSERLKPVRDFLRLNKEPIKIIPPLGGAANGVAQQLLALLDTALPEEQVSEITHGVGIGAALAYARNVLGYTTSEVIQKDMINPFTGNPVRVTVYTPPPAIEA